MDSLAFRSGGLYILAEDDLLAQDLLAVGFDDVLDAAVSVLREGWDVVGVLETFEDFLADGWGVKKDLFTSSSEKKYTLNPERSSFILFTSILFKMQ